MSREVPEAVRVAAARHGHLPAPQQRPVTRGDLVVVENAGVTRIVCVTEVLDTHLVAVLCSNETEMATDRDVVVHRHGTFDVLLEAECYLVVLPAQVRGVVGVIDLDAVNAVRGSLASDAGSVEALADRTGYTVGLPLDGVTDPRRAFMERELDDVVVLRDPAHRALFDDGWNPGRR